MLVFGLALSLPLVTFECDVTKFACLSAPSPVYDRFASPKTGKLASDKTRTLAKGHLWDPGRCWRVRHPPPLLTFFFTFFGLCSLCFVYAYHLVNSPLLLFVVFCLNNPVFSSGSTVLACSFMFISSKLYYSMWIFKKF